MFKKTLFIIFILILLTMSYRFFSDSKKENTLLFMATTTLEDSGLLKVIIRQLSHDTGLNFKVITAGTGRTLRTARDGNADFIITHDKTQEEGFINDGYATKRIELFYNDFILIGPKSDPAKVKSAPTIVQAMININDSKHPFISRGDQSGTHAKEISLWHSAQLSPKQFNVNWYIKTGLGMGASLNIAVQKGAYILTDRATWVNFKNMKNNRILFQDVNNPTLQNIYSLLPLNKAKFPDLNISKKSIVTNWFKSNKLKYTLQKFSKKSQNIYHHIPINNAEK